MSQICQGSNLLGLVKGSHFRGLGNADYSRLSSVHKPQIKELALSKFNGELAGRRWHGPEL